MVFSATITNNDNLTSSWQWQSFEGLPYLTCTLLLEWQHGFFTQQFYPQLPSNLIKVFNSTAEAYRTHQVHGNVILTPSEIARGLNDADGIITDKPNQGVFVASADCNPVLIADIVTKTVASVHAGWRGVAQKIVPATIERFKANGSKIDNLLLAIGPSISGEVYQVDLEVALSVCSTIIKDNENIIEKAFSLNPSPLLSDPQPNKVRLDLRQVLLQQVLLEGLTPEQVAIAPYCTYQQKEYFFSYRRTKEKKVQWSGIISN